MITKSQIATGIKNGAVQFIIDPNMESGTVCKIGDNWFYFGGASTEEENPESYIKNVSLEDIINEVFCVLEEFRYCEDFLDEYYYYEAVLQEAVLNNSKSK